MQMQGVSGWDSSSFLFKTDCRTGNEEYDADAMAVKELGVGRERSSR